MKTFLLIVVLVVSGCKAKYENMEVVSGSIRSVGISNSGMIYISVWDRKLNVERPRYCNKDMLIAVDSNVMAAGDFNKWYNHLKYDQRKSLVASIVAKATKDYDVEAVIVHKDDQ